MSQGMHVFESARNDLIEALRLSPTNEEAQKELAEVEQVSPPAMASRVIIMQERMRANAHPP